MLAVILIVGFVILSLIAFTVWSWLEAGSRRDDVTEALYGIYKEEK